MRCLTASGSLTTFRPHTTASPEVGASNPVSILTVVDFPAPLGPRKAQIVPMATSRVRWSTAVKPPKRRVRSRQELINQYTLSWTRGALQSEDQVYLAFRFPTAPAVRIHHRVA